jgi:hypothetical protein
MSNVKTDGKSVDNINEPDVETVEVGNSQSH